MTLATEAWRESRVRSARIQVSNSATSGALRSRRTAKRRSADSPFISRSMSNSASMRLTASRASGEIGAASLPRLLAAAMSASS